MKNLSKVLALVLVIAMVFSLAVSAGAAVSYKDMASVNYDEAVQLLTALEVTTGYDTDGDGKGDTFKPGENITRAELAVMVSYMVANKWSEYGLYDDIYKLNADYKALCTFADAKDHWAAGYIAFCASNKYLSGRDANTFDPEANVTVAEASVILLRVMGYNAEIEEYGTTAGTVKGYNTQLDARNAGLLNGLENVSFFAAATREQVAQLVMNALDGYVVVYNNYAFTLIQDKDSVINWGNIGIFQTNTATMTANKLVKYCFSNVAKNTGVANEYGLLGHQWVNTDGEALTDIYVDDTALATFVGGTSYSAIASKLGLSSVLSKVKAEVYVNGLKITAANGLTDGLAGMDGTLNDVYKMGVLGAALPDNCALTVVRNYDRTSATTVYKLMYYYEYVATISKATQVASSLHPFYGQYAYTVSVFDAFADTAETAVIYSNSDTTYNKDAFYLVVPNATTINSNATMPTVNGIDPFLSIKLAETVPSFKALNGKFKNIADNNNDGYIYNATTKYEVSDVAHNFGGAGYNVDMMLVMNTAGQVIGYAENKGSSLIAGTGYVYVDGVEFGVSVTAGSNYVNPAERTWSAQAKALVYFPEVGGNAAPTVVDIKTVQNPGYIYGGYAMIDNVNAYSDTYVDQYPVYDEDNALVQTWVKLPYKTTDAYWDYVGDYNWSANNSSVRVYDYKYDGWYNYTQYVDGSYALTPIGLETITVQRGNANVAGGKLTSSTGLYNYTMDLGTMTASKTLVATGYKNIGSVTGAATTYGTDVAPVAVTQFLDKVGGEVTFVKGLCTAIEEFFVLSAGDKYDYTWFVGKDDFSYAEGQYAVKFYVDGALETLYMDDEVIWNGSAVNAQDTEISNTTALSYLESTLKDANEDGHRDNLVAYTLTVVDGYITAIDAFKLEKGTVASADVDGWIVLTEDDTSYAANYITSNVWNAKTGVADSPAKDDIVYFWVDDDDTVDVDAMWIKDPKGNDPYGPGRFDGGWEWWH